MNIELNGDQTQAAKLIQEWLISGTLRHFVLCGLAGTGKTTMLRWVVENYIDGKVICVAPTNKAVQVLRSKMPEETRCVTVHSLIKKLSAKLYDATLNKIVLEFADKKQSEVNSCDLIICDESSMVPLDMANELLRNCNGARVLFVGDNAQLPPVSSISLYTAFQPNYTLTTLIRQVAGSEIAEFASRIRQGDLFYRPKDSNDILFRKFNEIDYWHKAKQVLSGTHRTRREVNKLIRPQLGFGGALPNRGERLVCSKPCNAVAHSIGLFSGTQAICLSEPISEGNRLRASLEIDGRVEGDIRNVALEPFDEYNGRVNNAWQRDDDVIGLDFAYAITVHKAQGSEWDYGIFVDDWRDRNFEFNLQLVYTAVTRFKRQIVIAGKN
jgi:exodeoxyribonuclease-5